MQHHSAGEVFTGLGPYVLLVVFVLLWGYKPMQTRLNRVNIVINWPWLHNLIQRMPPAVTKPAPMPRSST